MDARWGFLRAWCAPVRGVLSIERALQPHVPYERFDGIRVEIPRKSGGRDRAAMLRGIRHSLVLLTLVERVDPHAWRHALVDYCALDMENEDDMLESEDFRPRFLLLPEEAPGLELNEWPGVVLRDLAGSVDRKEEKAFAATVKRVASMLERNGDASGPIEIPLAVRVTLAYMADDVEDMDAYARSMWHVLSEINTTHGGYRLPGVNISSDEERATPECVFVLGQIEMDSTRQELTPGLVDVLEDMITSSDGLEFSQFAVNVCAGSSEHFSHDTAVRAMGRLVQFLLCMADTSSRAVLDAVSLDCQNLSEPEFARLFSAIAAARSTERLTLSLDMDELDPVERASMWEQLAFALFSKHSRSTVRNLTLFGAYIGNEDADTISLLLDAEDPSAMLFGALGGQDDDADAEASERIETTSSQHQAWMLSKGTTISFQQMSPDEEIFSLPTWPLDKNIRSVTVLDDDGERDDVTVLVPGYGVCKTRRDRLVASSASQDESRAPTTAAVTALTLVFESGDREAREGLPRLLERIGGQLTYLWLQIIDFGDQLRVDDLLRWCPNLTTLVIHGIVVDTGSFLRVYRECNLQICELQCEFDDVSLLANKLAESSSLLARSLRRLSYSFQPRGHPVIDAHFIAIAEMLQRNRTLEYLDLMVPLDKADQVSVALKESHDESLPVMRERFPLSCRLAFISVFCGSASDNQDGVKPKRVKNKPSASHRAVIRLPEALDRHVIAKIFDFAATCVQRKVYIRHYRRRVA